MAEAARRIKGWARSNPDEICLMCGRLDGVRSDPSGQLAEPLRRVSGRPDAKHGCADAGMTFRFVDTVSPNPTSSR